MLGRHEIAKKPGAGVPGPGNYNPSTKFVEVALTNGISFASKNGTTEIKQGTTSQVLNPGPGNYEISSTIKRKGGPVFGKEQRPGVGIKAVSKIPGPGAYNSLISPGKPSVHIVT